MIGLGTTVQTTYRGNSSTSPGSWAIPSDSGTTYNIAIAAIADTEALVDTDLSVGRWVFEHPRPVIQLAFLLTDANNETASFQVFGARKFITPTDSGWSYVPIMSGQLIAGVKVFNGGSTLWADTITVSSSSLPSSAYRVCTNTDDLSWLEVDMRDFDKCVVVITRNGGTAASANLAFGGCTL
jgi:hypothetical protein